MRKIKTAKLIVRPHSGLANRIRVMVSGVGLARELNTSLRIVWEKDAGLNCEYEDLFKHNDSIHISKVDLRTRVVQLFMGKPTLLKLVGKMLGIGFVMFDRDMHRFVWKYDTSFIDPNIIREHTGDIYLNLCNEFYFKRENLQYFLPNEDLQAEIDSIIRKFKQNTVGLHIRRTDHQHAINESPLELFIEKMTQEIEQDAAVNFYLATDDPEVKKRLIEKFGDRVLFSSIELTRSNLNGMRGALIDLYALAGTQKIYGSYFSSYSDIAARIGDIPLLVVKQ